MKTVIFSKLINGNLDYQYSNYQQLRYWLALLLLFMFRIMIISDYDEEDSGDEDDNKFTHAWYHFEDAIVFE